MSTKNEKGKALAVIAGGLLIVFLIALFACAAVLYAATGEAQVELAVVLAAIITSATYGILKHRA